MEYDVTIDRDKWIGGSDIAVIMGLSPFKTRYQLLLEKAGLQEDTFTGNIYTEYGSEMESKIRDFINKMRSTNFEPDRKYSDVLRCHVDGVNEDTILEIKTTSHIYTNVNDYKVYLVQLLTYMDVYGFKKGLLAVYERPSDFNCEFEPFRLNIHDISIEDYKDIVEDIKAEIARFKADLQRLKENPLLTEQDFQPQAVVEIANQVIQLENRMAAFKDLEKQYKNMKQKLYQAMYEADVKSWRMPNGTKITRVDGTPASVKTVVEFDSDSFKAEHADLYGKFTKETFKETAGRAGSVRITFPKE